MSTTATQPSPLARAIAERVKCCAGIQGGKSVFAEDVAIEAIEALLAPELERVKMDTITATAANLAISAASHAQSGLDVAQDTIREYGLAPGQPYHSAVKRLLGADQAKCLKEIAAK